MVEDRAQGLFFVHLALYWFGGALTPCFGGFSCVWLL
jgi:hypothetical protein